MKQVSFFSLIFLTAFTGPKADEEAVWKLEEAYWLYVKTNDLINYKKLWDEQFVGWPGFSDSPVGKESIGQWISPLHQNPEEVYDCEITRKAVRSFGKVVVVHYLVRDFMKSKRTGEIIKPRDTYRITHTWQRRGKTWQIITGMSGAQVSKTN